MPGMHHFADDPHAAGWIAAGRRWTTYNGSPSGNRLSALSLINTTNVAGLRLVRSFDIPNPSALEVTQLVSGDTMYITSVNSLYTFNLGTGKPGWSFVRPQTPGVVQDAGSGYNRGAALAANGVFPIDR